MNIIRSKYISENIYKYLSFEIEKSKIKPYIVIFQVGDLDRNTIYIKHKINACNKLNIKVVIQKFDETCKTAELCNEIQKVNNNKIYTCCMIQLPIPEHINLIKVLGTIDPLKDVDCCNLQNIGKLVLHKPYYIPATCLAILKIINKYKIKTKGKICVIIGKSIIVGRPIQILLSNEKTYAATTILCDKYTENLYELVKKADILISAAGKYNLINIPEMIKEECVIIDVGINTVIIDNKKKIRGDINFDNLKNKAKLITPVPGGVGPMTVACLMYNIYLSITSSDMRQEKYDNFLTI